MKKRITWIGAIVLVLVATLAVGFIGNITNGFQNFDKETISDNLSPKVNKENLYTAESLTLVDTNDGNGISVDVDEDTGAITVDGKAESTCEYVVGKVILDKGTYTLTAISGGSKSTVYATLIHGDTVEYFDFTPDNTIEISADDTEVTIKLYVVEGTDLNNKSVLPVIVPGEKSAAFYA